MKVHDLTPPTGSRKRAKRVARGIGGRGGKTAGRGMKGQKARSKVRVGFEGGQMPYHQRIPKLKGFKNPFRVEYQAVNLDAIEESGLEEVTPESLYALGMVGKKSLVKVLGRGAISRAVTVRVHAASSAAEAAIIAAGGTVEKLPLPFAVRPPARGNALTNR
ncbi:MAG: 50S ribosomal protein L15 [Acidimicrobiales bacterium]|nr:50S ribosomal protein L15 [Acidimicrobiales bacterium]